MKNSEYWQKRFELLEASQINKGVDFNRDLKKQYEIAKTYIQGRIADFYLRFAKNNQLDNLSDARKLLNKNELEEFKWTVYEYIDNAKAHGADKNWIKKLENASIKARVSRLEYIEMQMQQQAELLTALKSKGIKQLLCDVYYDKYIKTAYEVSKGLGVGIEVYGLNTETVEKIITKPWAPDGSNFSTRIWGSHRAQLVNSLKTQLSQSIIRGNGPKETIENISKLFDVDFNKASNLVQTELAFFSSAAQKDMFDELNVEKYEIVATLDTRTSEICQEMDGKVFDEKDYKEGVTAPPFHCRCRSTTCPYFDDEFTIDETRVARDPITGKTVTVPGNMKYKEWEEKCLKPLKNKPAGKSAVRNTRTRLEYNPESDFRISIEGYDNKINDGLSKACHEVAELGSKDGLEHLCLVDLNTGDTIYRETGKETEVGGSDFWSFIRNNSDKNISFVHNHNTDGFFSEADMRTLLSTDCIKDFSAVRIDGVIYYTQKKQDKKLTDFYLDRVYENELKELTALVRSGKISIAERVIKREEIIVENLLKDYTKGLIEFDGRK